MEQKSKMCNEEGRENRLRGAGVGKKEHSLAWAGQVVQMAGSH